MAASERAAERAIATLKRAIEAAENSNQAGEDFVCAAAAGPELLGALEEAGYAIVSLLSEARCLGRELDQLNERVPHLVGTLFSEDAIAEHVETLATVRAAIAKARGQ
jgi:hypothetical protein